MAQTIGRLKRHEKIIQQQQVDIFFKLLKLCAAQPIRS